MLLDSYKEFKLTEKVMVKKEVIYDFLISNFSSGALLQLPVIDYVMRKNNQLTISGIEHNPTLIIQTNFTFYECEGRLHYGQFTKCFPTFYIINPADFKD